MQLKIFCGENAVFYRKLFSLVLPVAFQQFMLAVVNASDALMLGVISQDALSAASLAGQITFVFNLFMGGLTMGTSILAAQYFGKGDTGAIEKIFGYVAKISLITAAPFFAASMLAPRALMLIFTDDAALISGGVDYLRFVAASYLFTALSQIYLCVLKNTGFAVKSMVIGSSAVVINLFLNAALIYGLACFPRLEIAGAALATSIAKFIELAWAYAESLRAGRVRLRAHCFISAEKWLASDYWRYTAPILGDYLVWGVGFTMYSVIMGHLGSDAVAANSMANIAKNLIVSFCAGLANGGGIIVGNALGVGALDLAKHYGALLCRTAVAGGVAAGLLLAAFTPSVVRFASLTPEASGYLRSMLLLCACYMTAKSFNMATIAGIFPAGGDSKFGLICDAVTMWCFAVPAGMLAAFYFKLPVVAVFLIINLDEVVKIPAAVAHYKKYGWLRDITR